MLFFYQWRNVRLNLNISNKISKDLEDLAQKAFEILKERREEIKKLTDNINKFSENFTNTVDNINTVKD